jgi:hypothetical protein
MALSKSGNLAPGGRTDGRKVCAIDDLWWAVPGGIWVEWSGLVYTAVLSFNSGEAVSRRATRAVRTFALGTAVAFNLNALGKIGMSITSTITESHVTAACSLVIATATVSTVNVAVAACAPAPAAPDN